jgi:hypothetical protein
LAAVSVVYISHFNSLHKFVYLHHLQTSIVLIESTHGAGSPIMDDAVKRITAAFSSGGNQNDLHASAVRTSFILSVDQAHAVHPNYCNKHERNHGPKVSQNDFTS